MEKDSKSAEDPSDLAPTSNRDPLVGLKLGEFVVQRRLGAGGMGVVYEGLQPVIGKPVAIKILQIEMSSGEDTAALVAEARAANAVRHRGIVDVFSFGTLEDGRPYIVMELLEGAPLDAVIRRDAPLAIEAALRLMDDILDPLSAAHAAGVIHRDLKPANIFLVQTASGTSYTKILDFGLARQTQIVDGIARQTAVGGLVGTPHYMAPEQAKCEAVSPRSDLYAAGCIAYELLTGQPPFDASSPIQLLSAHINAPIPRPSDSNSEVPPEVDALVVQLLAKNPEQRPASAQVVRRRIAKLRAKLAESHTQVARDEEAIRAALAAAEEPAAPEAPSEEDEPTGDAMPRPETVRMARQPVREHRPRRLGIAMSAAAVVVAGLAAWVLLPWARSSDVVSPPAVEEPRSAAATDAEPAPALDAPVPSAPALEPPPAAQTRPAKPKPKPRPAGTTATKAQLLRRVDRYKAEYEKRASRSGNPASLKLLMNLRSEIVAAEKSELPELGEALRDWRAANLAGH